MLLFQNLIIVAFWPSKRIKLALVRMTITPYLAVAERQFYDERHDLVRLQLQNTHFRTVAAHLKNEETIADARARCAKAGRAYLQCKQVIRKAEANAKFSLARKPQPARTQFAEQVVA